MNRSGECYACGGPDDYGAAYQFAMEKARQGVPMHVAVAEGIEAAKKLRETFYPSALTAAAVFGEDLYVTAGIGSEAGK